MWAILYFGCCFNKGFAQVKKKKNIHDSFQEVKISTLTEVWKRLIPTFMDDFEGFKASVEEELQMWWK